PGDERSTNVPSFPTLNNGNRDLIYTHSTVLIERGDHIRIQQLSLSYGFKPRSMTRRWFDRLELTLMVSNFGTLWTMNESGIDPDRHSLLMQPSKNYTVKMNLSF